LASDPELTLGHEEVQMKNRRVNLPSQVRLLSPVHTMTVSQLALS